MKRVRGLACWITLAVAGFAAGCSSEMHPVKFNEKMCDGNKRIGVAAQAFRQSLVPLQAGRKTTPAAVRAAYDDVLAAIDF